MRGIIILADYILALPGIALALTIHGYFQASISRKLGDPYPKLHGRLRASPRKHLELTGFLLMLLYGYGWGMPVTTSDTYYKNKKLGKLITYAAPSLINLLFAFTFFVFLLVIKQLFYALSLDLPLSSQGFAHSLQTINAIGFTAENLFSMKSALFIVSGSIYQILFMFVKYNLAAAFINLIPIYPLDGFAILENYLPAEYRYKYSQYKNILLLILLLLFISGFINALFDPVVHFLLRAIQ